MLWDLTLTLCHPADPSTCSSTRSERWAKFFNGQEKTLQPGSPCNDFKGYCDVFNRCRLVDADGPLARLKKAIFNPELYENIADWIVVSVCGSPIQYVRNAYNFPKQILPLWHIMCYIFCCSGSLVGCALDGYCSYYADGGFHQDLQCAHPKQQPQTSSTKTTPRYKMLQCFINIIKDVYHKMHVFTLVLLKKYNYTKDIREMFHVFNVWMKICI